jgi:DNA polymerase III subunit alpha
MIIHLNTHSAYSLQEGLLLPSELVHAAKSCGMPALGLTDHRLLSGTVEFVVACQKANIQPIIGLEIDLAHGPLTLLAASRSGWANLCHISSKLALREVPEASCTPDEIAAYSDELIAIYSSWTKPDSDFSQLIDRFPDRFYLALQNPKQILSISRCSKEYSLPVVATHPVYYLAPEQASLQRTLAAIRLNKRLIDIQEDDLAPKGAYFITPSEMEKLYAHYPKAIDASIEIAERCKFDFPIGEIHMPAIPLPSGESAAQVLRNKATKGAQRLYGGITPNIQERLDHELTVIARMGYEPIFLIVEEILAFARQKGVPFSSRGSAASSLVAHCLEITSPDPLYHNLYFERFLNPARSSPPDIDTDLCSRRRGSVIQHVFDTYGTDRVAMVATINRYRPRSALGDVAKAHGLAKELIRKMVNKLPYSFFAQRQTEETEGVDETFTALREMYPQKLYQKILDESESLLKLPRHLSVHAGGLIVAPGFLTDLVPVMKSGSKGMIITQMDHEAVELLGLVKIDLLGIRGLTVLGDVAEYIQKRGSVTKTNINTVLNAIPDVDAEVSECVEFGKTIGCFQIESPGMRSILRDIKARSEEDIIAALALYRPGPLKGGLKDAFVRRFKGEEEVRHIHPALAPLLDETFGVILYQEQVLRIAHELAGFSLDEADLLRRAMSHFDPGKRMQELKRKFIAEAQLRKGFSQETSERVWEMIAAFAGYGFPKAHASSYAGIAWRSAWCKTHFPAEFMAAVMANRGGYYRQSAYISEARRMGLCVRGPHVNYSRDNFSVQRLDTASSNIEEIIFMGLGQVRELTKRTMEKIMVRQPFASLEEFLLRVDPRPQEAENLARVGAFDDWGNGPAILRRLQSGKWQAGQMSLFSTDLKEEEDWSNTEMMIAQQELLGISLTVHPLDVMKGKLKSVGAIPISEAIKRVRQRVTIAGLRQSSRRSKTSKGETMMFLNMEDQNATLDAILFPDAYRQGHHLVSSTSPFLITGVIEMDASGQEVYLRAEKVERLY